MPRYLPVCLNLEGRLAVIVGGGNVGTQKLRDFLGCGAHVHVVSPVVSDAIRDDDDQDQQRRGIVHPASGQHLARRPWHPPVPSAQPPQDACPWGRLHSRAGLMGRLGVRRHGS